MTKAQDRLSFQWQQVEDKKNKKTSDMFVISLVKLKEQCINIYGNTVLKYHFKVLVHYWSVLYSYSFFFQGKIYFLLVYIIVL